jgi:hypothetical protein
MSSIAASCSSPDSGPRLTGRVKQPLNGALDLIVLAFAIVLEHDLAIPIDDVLRRPILVAVGIPRGVSVTFANREIRSPDGAQRNPGKRRP